MSANASTIDLTSSPYQLVASFNSDGLVNLDSIGTWNGQPVSPSNMPTDSERELSATFNVFVNPQATNVLYLQVTNVLTTRFGYATGLAFDNVTLTGVQVTNTNPASILSFSSNFANPGEMLFDNTGGPYDVLVPLDTTPGYQLSSGPNNFLISTSDTQAFDGFTSFGGVYGTNRIMGGGIFQLTYAPPVNAENFNFSQWNVSAEYGNANQFIGSSLVSPTPEPNTKSILCCFLGIALIARCLSVSSRARS